MNIKIILGRHFFTTWEKIALNITSVNQLNGFYTYDDAVATVNVTSNEFKNKANDASIIRLFCKVVTHESLHHAIADCMGNVHPFVGEENIVLWLSNQAK